MNRCRRRGACRARGFTLLEVLVAMTLLAMGLALAFAVVRSTQAAGARGGQVAAGNERMRAVQNLLRRQLQATLALDQPGTGTATHIQFLGEPARMRFVADLPAYLGEGGPYLHQVHVDAGDQRLWLGLEPLPPGDGPPGQPGARRTELLAEHVRAIRCRYRGLDAGGRPSGWQSHWAWPERLPLQVECVIEPERGEPWPPLVVSLPQGAGGASP